MEQASEWPAAFVALGFMVMLVAIIWIMFKNM